MHGLREIKQMNKAATAGCSRVKQDRKQALVASLASYVSGDDVELDRLGFLELVASRISDDVQAASREAVS
jgi:hypothetical protein